MRFLYLILLMFFISAAWAVVVYALHVDEYWYGYGNGVMCMVFMRLISK